MFYKIQWPVYKLVVAMPRVSPQRLSNPYDAKSLLDTLDNRDVTISALRIRAEKGLKHVLAYRENILRMGQCCDDCIGGFAAATR
jgi:hypothetical protein